MDPATPLRSAQDDGLGASRDAAWAIARDAGPGPSIIAQRSPVPSCAQSQDPRAPRRRPGRRADKRRRGPRAPFVM